MPLQKLQFRPGVNREGTTLSNEGGWYACDKVRFRSGYPEKIGGWTAVSLTSFLGVCRSLWNWVSLKSFNLLGVGTNLKFYIEDGGAYYDITPIREINGNTPSAGPPVINPSTITLAASGLVLTVSDSAAESLQVNDFVTIAGAGTIGGVDVNGQYQITSVLSGTMYTVALSTSTTGSNAASTITIAYQINTGNAVYTVGTGWGTGSWSRLTWGSGFTTGIGQQLRLWSQINFGQSLLFSPREGPMYYWDPGLGTQPDYTVRGTLVTGPECPTKILQLLISDATRIVIALGSNPYSFDPTPNDLDPLLIRWSVAEDYTNWSPSITNQAGSYRLSHGSSIIGGIQTRQENLVWTNTAVYSMQYAGPPYIWTFNILADNISIASPSAMTTVNGVVYWMGVDKFYMYAGRVETLPSALREFVFSDINVDQLFQVIAGTNEGYNEVWWHYPSITGPNGTGTPQNPNVINDRYVIFNHLDRVWYYGTLSRTAWLDSPLRTYPVAADASVNRIVLHELGVDNNSGNTPIPIDAYIQSSDFDIGDGHNYGFVYRIIPDITFNNSNTPSGQPAQVDFTVLPRRNPGAPYGSADSPEVESAQNYSVARSYPVQQFTEIVYTRVRGRQVAFKVQSNTLGTQWQLGVPRIDVRKDGRR
jgi:hypothetical protein